MINESATDSHGTKRIKINEGDDRNSSLKIVTRENPWRILKCPKSSN
jgi:hypothetical protein